MLAGFARRVLLLLTLCAAGVAAPGCFHILHYVTVNADGSLDIQWRITAARETVKAGKKRSANGEKSPADPGLGGAIGATFFGKEILSRIQPSNSVRNVTLGNFTTEFDSIRSVAFRLKKSRRKPLDETFTGGMPIVPEYDPVKKRISFYFPWGDEAYREKLKAKAANTKTDSRPAAKQPEDPQGKRIAAMMLSTGRYQIVIAGAKVKRVHLVTTRGGHKRPVQALPMGNITLINFPFLAAVQKYDENGIRLVVELH